MLLALLAATSLATAPAPATPDVVIDKSDRTLVVIANGRTILRVAGVKLGDDPTGHKQFEGDERTSEGLYTIDRRNAESRFHRSLGLSYPNSADQAD